MNRRELLKTSLLGLGAGAMALSGCNKKEAEPDINQDITPKQTAQYEFSAPMPFDYQTIDKIIALNSTLKKSRVTTFYNNIPMPLVRGFDQFVQVHRGFNETIRNYEDFKNIVQYSIANGFKFVYLMNSPKPFSPEDFNMFQGEFMHLLDYLEKIGCSDIKVGNTQVAELINQIAPNKFTLSSSTSFEYHNVSQYHYLFNNYPNFDLIDISNDENHNFPFLRSLRKTFPDKKLELMINEPCIKGCPARISHIAEYGFCKYNCHALQEKMGEYFFFYKLGSIYPWNLEYYSALGINNFKYSASGSMGGRANYNDISQLSMYLNMVEHGIKNYSADDFFNGIYERRFNIRKDLKIADVIPYMPDVHHFIKHGDKCAINCDVNCHYCELCGKRTENFLNS
ncbi:MAG: hypothetical protein IJ877_06975 [Candidatus Gastranaerophilales bacterium]|nr:hypothetical protein [Candidatus Gastranaerophilales bacterium]